MSTKQTVKTTAVVKQRRERAPKTAPVPMTEPHRMQVLEEGVRRLQHARSQCMMMLPGCAAALLQYPSFAVLDERVSTACTNGVAMYFNPLFLQSLSDDECAFLYAHEVWHNLLLHGFRAADREARRWNIACDLEVNHILMTHGMTPVAGGWFLKPPVHSAAERWYQELGKGYGELSRAIRERPLIDRRRGGHIWDKPEPGGRDEDSEDDDMDVPTRSSARRQPAWLRDIQGLRDPDVMLEPDPDAVSTATTLAESLESSMTRLVTRSWQEGEAGDVPAAVGAAAAGVSGAHPFWQGGLESTVAPPYSPRSVFAQRSGAAADGVHCGGCVGLHVGIAARGGDAGAAGAESI